jgi:hypothetical protein
MEATFLQRPGEREKQLNEFGIACVGIAKKILEKHYEELKEGNVFFIVPLRGALPVWEGVEHALYKLKGSFEAQVVFIPASSIIEERKEMIREIIKKILEKNREYKTIIVVDEAISGSSSLMVFESVKDGVKALEEDKEWKREYWKHYNVELYIVCAYNGEKLNERIKKLFGCFIKSIQGEIPTMDKPWLLPLEYTGDIEIVEGEGKIAKKIKRVGVISEKNENWKEIRKAIDEGVEKSIEEWKIRE